MATVFVLSARDANRITKALDNINENVAVVNQIMSNAVVGEINTGENENTKAMVSDPGYATAARAVRDNPQA